MRSAIAASGHQFRTKNVSRRAQSIVISPIKEMSILADEYAAKSKKWIISFGQGIPFFDTPDYIKNGMRKSLNKISTSKYTLEPGMTELRQLIAKDLKQRKQILDIKPKKEIMVSAGCQEAVACALAATIDPGDEVLLFSPGFASHIEQTIQWNGVPKFIPLTSTNGWRIDLKTLEKKITKKTKVILFSNPSNPTGTVLTQNEVKEIARVAKRYDLVIITDETYDFLTYDDIKHYSPASLPDIRDRVILCGSFSKRYAMTGYRVGFAFADTGILDQMLKFHDALTICAPAISQEAAITALSDRQKSRETVKEVIKKLTFNRKLMCQKLDELADFFEYQKPQGAYYILAKYDLDAFNKMNSFDLALKILYETQVITIPGAAFGPTGEGHLRFSFAGLPEEIEEGFERLSEWIKTFKR